MNSLLIPRVLPVVVHSVCSNLLKLLFSNKINYVVFPSLTNFKFSSPHCNRYVMQPLCQAISLSVSEFVNKTWLWLLLTNKYI